MTKPAAVKNILKIRFVITRGYFCDLNVRKIFFEKFSAAAKFGFFFEYLQVSHRPAALGPGEEKTY